MQVYTNIRKFKEDLSLYPPHHFVCVPLVLDTLYGRVSPPTHATILKKQRHLPGSGNLHILVQSFELSWSSIDGQYLFGESGASGDGSTVSGACEYCGVHARRHGSDASRAPCAGASADKEGLGAEEADGALLLRSGHSVRSCAPHRGGRRAAVRPPGALHAARHARSSHCRRAVPHLQVGRKASLHRSWVCFLRNTGNMLCNGLQDISAPCGMLAALTAVVLSAMWR